MSGYGQVLSGGASMRKGLSKDINDKHKSREGEIDRREVIAGAVRKAFTVKSLSTPQTNNIHKNGKFTKPSVPSKV